MLIELIRLYSTHAGTIFFYWATVAHLAAASRLKTSSASETATRPLRARWFDTCTSSVRRAIERQHKGKGSSLASFRSWAFCVRRVFTHEILYEPYEVVQCSSMWSDDHMSLRQIFFFNVKMLWACSQFLFLIEIANNVACLLLRADKYSAVALQMVVIAPPVLLGQSMALVH